MSYFDTYSPVAAAAASQYGVPQQLFFDVISAESGWNPNAYNYKSGATGIAQFLPSTAANAGYGISSFDPWNPTASIYSAAQYLSALYNRTGSWTGALNSYSGNSAGGLPYASSKYGSAIAADIANLTGNQSSGNIFDSGSASGGSGSSGGGSGGGGGGGVTQASSGTWDKIKAWFGDIAPRAALVVVGLTLILGALIVLAFRVFENSPSAKAVVKAAAI